MNEMNENNTKNSANPLIKKRVNSFFVNKVAIPKQSVNLNKILADYQKVTRTPTANPLPNRALPSNAHLKIVKKVPFSKMMVRFSPLFWIGLVVSLSGFAFPGNFLGAISLAIQALAWILIFASYHSKSNNEAVFLAGQNNPQPLSNTSTPTNNSIRMALASHYSASTPEEVRSCIDSLISSALKLNIKEISHEDFRYLKTTFEIDLPQLYQDINWETLKDNATIKDEMLSVLASIQVRVNSISALQHEATSKNIQVQLNYLKKKSGT